MKHIKGFIIGVVSAIALLGFAVTAVAVQITVPSAPAAGYALISTTTGAYITVATTTGLGLNVLPYYASTTIGNGTATGGLTVSGNATTTGTAYVGGNVGIGISTPQYSQVQIVSNSSGNFGGVLRITTTATPPNGDFFIATTDGSWGIGGNKLLIGAGQPGSGTAKIIMDSAGNVGIGSSPSYLLDVAGFINTDQYSGYKQAGNTVLYATSTTGATFGGIGAGAYSIAHATSTDVTSAASSTAFGYQALSTGTLTNMGFGNSAFGYQTLKANTTGYQNTGIGVTALTANTTGTNNSGLGFYALSKNTTGAGNVALGVQSLANNNANFNTAAGYYALFSNSTGLLNAAYGTQALQSATGSYNTALGAFAGQSVTGSNNVFIGDYTASSSSAGNYNIAIGYDVAVPVLAGSNQLNIGNAIFGTGLTSQSTTTPAGNIGIGTTTPPARLSVHANNGDTNTALFEVSSSTASTFSNLFSITNTGHIVASSTTPTLSSCGTSPSSTGDDTHGTVTVGATGTGCTVTFAQPFAADPVCLVTPQTGSVVNAFSYTHSTTNIVVTQTGIASSKFDYYCMGTR